MILIFITCFAVVLMHLRGMKGLYHLALYQKLVHLMGGLFFGSVGLYYGCPPVPFALVGGILWECFEYLIDTHFPKIGEKYCWYSRSWNDALVDVSMGIVGSSILTI